MRSEEEIRKRIRKLEEDLKWILAEKKWADNQGILTVGYALQIESIKDEIRILKWVLGEEKG